MPFKSEAQRRFMFAKHPEIAEAWSHGKSSVTGKKEFKPRNKGLPMHKRKKRSVHETRDFLASKKNKYY